MGTNYYLKTGEDCPTCGKAIKEDLHIGKRSKGWKFAFHSIPELGLVSYESWKPLLKMFPIHTEYGEEVSFLEFMDVMALQDNVTQDRLDPKYGVREIRQTEFYDFIEGNFS